MQGFDFHFPAVRGVQAGREFYVAMCPLAVIPKVFTPDESSRHAHQRGQRLLNKARVPQLARFLVENPGDYAFSAITACIDGAAEFEPIGEARDWELGRLRIPMSANLLITDGQHRWRAIREALSKEPGLANETVPVVLYLDEGLKRRQQIFADFNMHGVRPTRSLGILYDHRDPVAAMARTLANEVPLFAGRTEVERTTISNRSANLFTLSAIYQATAALLGKQEGDSVADAELGLARRFWQVLGDVIPEWSAVIANEAKPWKLRAEYVHAHGVVLQALGAAGCQLLNEVDDWEVRLRSDSMVQIDWSRSNKRLWEGRALSHGRVSKARKHVVLTASYVKRRLGLAPSPNEMRLEDELSQSRGISGDEAA